MHWSKQLFLDSTGPPLPPVSILQEVNATMLRLWWEEPFTWDGFPIQNYVITVRSSLNHTLIKNSAVEANEKELFFTNESIAESCFELEFTIVAVSAIGQSQAVSVNGGFPISKSIALSTIQSTHHVTQFKCVCTYFKLYLTPIHSWQHDHMSPCNLALHEHDAVVKIWHAHTISLVVQPHDQIFGQLTWLSNVCLCYAISLGPGPFVSPVTTEVFYRTNSSPAVEINFTVRKSHSFPVYSIA